MSPLRLLGRRGKLLELYRRMVLVRAFEAATGRAGDPHESIAVGAAAALEADDYLVTSDRPHRFALARGVDPRAVMPEILGDVRVRREWRIVGGGLRAATDLAPALVRGDRSRAILCVPGGRTAHPAAVHRTMGIAASRRLPVVLLLRVDLAGGEDGTVDGGDVAAVHAAASRLLERARRRREPAVLEVAVDGAAASAVAPDPLSVAALQLAELGAPPEQLLEIAGEAEEVVAEAVDRVTADAVSELIEATSPASPA